MKKIAILLTVVVALLSFSSCGGNESKIEQTENNVVSGKPESVAVETESVSFVNNGHNGVPAQLTLAVYNKDNMAQYFHITFPTDEGSGILYGQGSKALDGTVVFSGGSFLDETIECDSVKDIASSFAERWEKGIESLRHDSAYSNFNFKVHKSEMVEVNGKSMCRYEGTHTYDLTDFKTGKVNSFSCYFVAYGTEHSGGGYVYWVVMDDSASQYLSSQVKSNADNMAKSFEETSLF